MRALISILFILCVFSAWAAEEPQKIKAVATFSILADMAKNVGGDKVEVIALVGPNGDVHTFEPSPQDSISLVKAKVIFENGLHFEHWLDKIYAASGTTAKRVIVSDGVEPIEAQEGNAVDVDPHIWHDVSNAMIMVERIRDGLIVVDEANAAYYRENTEKYLAALAGLDHWIIDTLKDIPDEKRNLVTSHDSFGYFVKRYGFKVVGTAAASATTEAADPSAAQMVQLIETIKSQNVGVVFIEHMHNSKALASIAEEAKVKLAPALYADELSDASGDAGTYIKMIKHNVFIFAQELK